MGGSRPSADHPLPWPYNGGASDGLSAGSCPPPPQSPPPSVRRRPAARSALSKPPSAACCDREPVAPIVHDRLRRSKSARSFSSAQIRKFAPICESCVSNGTLGRRLAFVFHARASPQSLASSQ